jgi:hypothetical protein
MSENSNNTYIKLKIKGGGYMFKKLLAVFVGIMLLLLLLVSFTGKRIKQVVNVKYDHINKIVFYDGSGGKNKPITLEDKEKIKEFMNYLNEYTIRKVKNPEKTGWIHSAVLYDNYNKEMKITFGSPIEITQTEHYAGEVTPDIMMARKYTDTTVWFYYPGGINGKYRFDHIETKNTSINFIRNIKIGDSLVSVLSKFPNENRRITSKYGEKIKPLYGEPVHLSNYGRITYPDDKTISVWYADSWNIFKFEFNNNKELIKVVFSYTD